MSFYETYDRDYTGVKEQNQKNRLDAYQDREEIYERQRKKMHDYKNQLYTIQTLLKTGKAEEALSFTEKLTESVAVDLSAINTNHPVVNAVLNQKYRSMQEKNIAVINCCFNNRMRRQRVPGYIVQGTGTKRCKKPKRGCKVHNRHRTCF